MAERASRISPQWDVMCFKRQREDTLQLLLELQREDLQTRCGEKTLRSPPQSISICIALQEKSIFFIVSRLSSNTQRELPGS